MFFFSWPERDRERGREKTTKAQIDRYQSFSVSPLIPVRAGAVRWWWSVVSSSSRSRVSCTSIRGLMIGTEWWSNERGWESCWHRRTASTAAAATTAVAAQTQQLHLDRAQRTHCQMHTRLVVIIYYHYHYQSDDLTWVNWWPNYDWDEVDIMTKKADFIEKMTHIGNSTSVICNEEGTDWRKTHCSKKTKKLYKRQN